MNGLLWIAQILLAAVFLIAAAGKLFAYGKVVKVVAAHSKSHTFGVGRGQAALMSVAEIAGAIGVITPIQLEPPHLIVLIAALWLAALMVGTGIYHALRKESAAPDIAIFLLALFIIVGRWPH